MTIRFRFSKSDLITAAGVAMRPLEIDDKGGLFERLGQPGITERLTHEELADLLRQPDTAYIAGYFDRAKQDLRGRKPTDIFNGLAQDVRRLVIWRRAVCDAFLAFGPTLIDTQENVLNLSPTGDLDEAAKNLFAMLRALDQPHFKAIAVMPIPEIGLGIAINDRLKRAAADRD